MTTQRRTRSPRGSGEILAGEIITAATELLVELEDVTAVSIRAVANRVGVTPPSIYRHFADKDALLDAVCARYFENLDSAMAAASDDIADPIERGLQQGLAYVRFALANPVLYLVAFRKPPQRGEQLKVDEVLAAAAYTRFTATVREIADEGLFAGDDVGDIVTEFWAAAHGVASLMLAKPGLQWGRGGSQELHTRQLRLAENILRSACYGRAAMTALGARAEPEAMRAWLRAGNA